MHHKHSFPVSLLDLIGGHQVSHAHRFPARLSFPQDRMQGGDQGPDIPLLPLDPVQDLSRFQEQERKEGHLDWVMNTSDLTGTDTHRQTITEPLYSTISYMLFTFP